MVPSITTSYVSTKGGNQRWKLKGTIARAGEYGENDKEEYHCKSGMIEVM